MTFTHPLKLIYKAICCNAVADFCLALIARLAEW